MVMFCHLTQNVVLSKISYKQRGWKSTQKRLFQIFWEIPQSTDIGPQIVLRIPSITSPELLLNILSFRGHPLGTSWSGVPRTSQLIVSEMSWINLLETYFWKRCPDVPQRTFRRSLKVVVGSSVTCHQISFYFFPKLNAILRGKFKNQSSIYDAAFL